MSAFPTSTSRTIVFTVPSFSGYSPIISFRGNVKLAHPCLSWTPSTLSQDNGADILACFPLLRTPWYGSQSRVPSLLLRRRYSLKSLIEQRAQPFFHSFFIRSYSDYYNLFLDGVDNMCTRGLSLSLPSTKLTMANSQIRTT